MFRRSKPKADAKDEPPADVDEEKERLLAEAKEAASEFLRAQEKIKTFKQLIEQTATIQEEVKRISKSLGKRLPGLEESLSTVVSENDDSDESQNVVAKVKEMRKELITLKEVIPETRSLFNRFFLGKVNVKMWTNRDRTRLRDEYNKFKRRTVVALILFPALVLVFHFKLRTEWSDTHWMNVLHELWLMYYYVTLAIRENILIVNGSAIRRWWLWHHYLAAVGTVVLIMWPMTEIYLSYVPAFTCLALYNGLLQAALSWYHGRREYANRALGKLGHMDVTYKETLTEFPTELCVIMPFLFFAHVWEVCVGLSLLHTFTNKFSFELHWTEYTEELQILACGCIQITMGCGNFLSTFWTVQKKRQRDRSRHDKDE